MFRPTIETLLPNALRENGHFVSPLARQQLVNFLLLLNKWNTAFNLTALTTPSQMVYLHVIDSLSVMSYVHGARILDVGSGAGFPGLPLAIVQPKKKWWLLDTNSKKTRFLTQVIAELGLTNVAVIKARSEEFQPSQTFDTILVRALGPIGKVAHMTRHLLGPGGRLVMMKGRSPEIEATGTLEGFALQTVGPIIIQGIDVTRHVVCLIKTSMAQAISSQA